MKTSKLKSIEAKMQKRAFEEALKKKQAEDNIKLKEYLQSPDHKFPTTRRELLRAGLISMSGWMIGPSLLTLLSRIDPAYAAECVAPATTNLVPFIHLHFEGGFQTLAAATPKTTAGGPLQTYNRLGLGTTPTFQTPFSNGAELFDNGANLGVLQGILQTTDAATRANTAWITIPYRDNGDSADPTFSGIGLIERAGRAGAKLKVLGTDGTATGAGNAPNPAFNLAPTRPLQVQSVNTILQAVQFSGALATLNQSQQLAVAQTIRGLSSTQAASLTGFSGGENIMDLIECATDQNLKNITEGAGSLDPRQVTGVGAIWNNFTAENNGGVNYDNLRHSAMVMNTLNGNALGTVIEVGGYDIHNQAGQGRTVQEQRAFGIGRLIGRTLATARLLNTKVFIHVTTNGSNDNAGGTTTTPFNSDSSDYSGSHLVLFDPARAPSVTSAQIGGLNPDGTVDRTTVSAQVPNAVAAMFLNYSFFSGDGTLFDRVLPGRFDVAQKAFMRKVNT